MFAGGICSAVSSMNTTVPPRDRIWVSDPHGFERKEYAIGIRSAREFLAALPA
jgi:hypothetical protein